VFHLIAFSSLNSGFLASGASIQLDTRWMEQSFLIPVAAESEFFPQIWDEQKLPPAEILNKMLYDINKDGIDDLILAVMPQDKPDVQFAIYSEQNGSYIKSWSTLLTKEIEEFLMPQELKIEFWDCNKNGQEEMIVELNLLYTEDFTAIAPKSDLVAVIHFKSLNGYARVFKNGTVALISPKGTVSAKFRELEKRDWLRENYIRTLIDGGIKGKELQKALEAMDRVDSRLAKDDNGQMLAEMELKAQMRFQNWCLEKGMNPDDMSEEQVMELIDKVIHESRKK